MKVVKRDGRIENYDYEKIREAVKGAADDVGVTPPVLKISFKDKDKVTVDEIHNEVERHLMKAAPAVAKAYILYRQKRTDVREANSSLMKKTAELIHEMNHDNANTGNSPASKMYGIAETACKDFYLKNMKKKTSENHRLGRCYVHDMGYRNIAFNCFFSPLGRMLEHGFDNGVGTIRSPQRIGTAAALTCIILQSAQNDMFGGQGILHFDTDMAPYVTREYKHQYLLINGINPELSKKDCVDLAWELTDKATYQAMEALVYNLNTMRARSGAQVPFTSLNFGTDPSKEARMVSLNLLKAYTAGLGHGENPIFPNLCYRLQDGINLHEGEPNFDITQAAIECMGKRIQPRFVFCDSPAYPDKWDAGTMGCRTAVRTNVNGDNTAEARGNLAFMTMNLPMFALEAKQSLQLVEPDSPIKQNDLIAKFFEILSEATTDCINELHDRYDIIAHLRKKDMPFVASWYQGSEGLKDDDYIEPMIRNGSLSVGFIGLAETLIVLTGKHHGESKESQKLGLEIIKYIRKRTDEATKQYHLNYSCFASPAESACYTLRNAIAKRFGKVPHVTDKEYLTNSFHLPVSFKCDMKTKIDIEAPYHLLCNAGAIFYIELPSSPKFNPDGVLKVLQYMAKSGIVYGGLNYENDFCKDCGYMGTFDGACPNCGSKNIRVVKIITGYLSEISRFNLGKQAEAADRVSHAGGDVIG